MKRKQIIFDILRSLEFASDMWYESETDYLVSTNDDSIVIDVQDFVIKRPVFINLGFFEARKMKKAIDKWRAKTIAESIKKSYLDHYSKRKED